MLISGTCLLHDSLQACVVVKFLYRSKDVEHMYYLVVKSPPRSNYIIIHGGISEFLSHINKVLGGI